MIRGAREPIGFNGAMTDASENEPARGTRLRRGWRVFRWTLFAILVLAVECAYGLLSPEYSYPDELSHMQAVAYVQHEGELPDPWDAREKIQQDKHPPYFYVLSALALELSAAAFGEESGTVEVPGPWARTWDLSRVQVLSHRDQERSMRHGQLLVLRGLSILHWLLAAFAFLALADFVFPSAPRFAWSLAFGVATIPQAAWSGASATPDTPLVAFCAWAFYFLLRLTTCRDVTRYALAAGFACALALLTKAAAVCLVPVAGIATLLRLKSGTSAQALRTALLLAVPSLLLAAWWYVYNFVEYGDFFQMHGVVETYTHAVRREPLTWVTFEAMFWDVFRTFFGFDVRERLLPRPLYFVFAALVGIAICGLALLGRRALRSEISRTQGAALVLGLPAILTMLALTILGNTSIPSAQGRYLYPVLPAILVCFGVGWRVAVRARGDSRVVPLLAVAWAFAGIWLFGSCVVARVAVLRSHAASPGVLFYEDCGSPGLHPHEVQGLDAPDAGMLGRILPERSVSGHPEAVVYRFEAAPLRRRRDEARGAGVLSAALQVRVLYFNPDSSTPYVADQVGRFVYATQRLLAGSRVVHGPIELTGQTKEFFFPLEDEDIAGETLELRFEKVSGLGAAVAELWIEDAHLILERGEGAGAHLRLRNRSPEAHRVELSAKPAAGEARVMRVDLAAGDEATLDESMAELVRQASSQLQVLSLERSPWSLREAESWIDRKNGRWFGQIDASGAYFVSVPSRRPRGPVLHAATIVANLPFEGAPVGARLMLREHRSQLRGAWSWREVSLEPGPGFDGKVFAYEVPAKTSACLDYAILVGGWRR